MSTKTMSPYFLSTNDNPGNIITQVQLKGDNYDEWARVIRTALQAKKKFGFIDGSVKQPSDESSEQEDWWTVNSMLVSWILNTIEPGLRSTITHMEIAKQLWDDIKERFSVGNGPRIHQLKAELAACKQRGLTVVNYYGKLKKIWEELGNYEQNSTCCCGRCTCDISAELDKRREEERLHQFLMGLDDSIYGTVRSNILSAEPLSTLNRAYAIIVQEESVRDITREKEGKGEAMAFAIQTKQVSKERYENTDKTEVCSHCNKSGHNSNSCFQLIGYPEWWGDRTQGNKRGAGRGLGGTKQSGRSDGRGGKGRGGPIRANAAIVEAQENTNQGQIVELDKTGISGLSSEQWSLLISMLNSHKEGNQGRLNGMYALVEWLIDTGANHHMTGCLEKMNNVKEVLPCPVGLPDGTEAIAEKEGTVVLNEHLKLKNVLFVPNLKCNLISASKLARDSRCFILVTDEFCVIQDRNTRKLIGAGEMYEGLYHF